MKKKSNSYFHSLQLALQLQEEERREQQQRQQQQQQRTQSRPQPARGSPSRSNILPQSQQQSSNSNQQRAESAVRQFVYKKDTTFIGGQVCCEAQCLYGIFCQVLISLCTSNVRKISNFRDFFFFFFRNIRVVLLRFHWQVGKKQCWKAWSLTLKFLKHLSARITQSIVILLCLYSPILGKCNWTLPADVVAPQKYCLLCHVHSFSCSFCLLPAQSTL